MILFCNEDDESLVDIGEADEPLGESDYPRGLVEAMVSAGEGLVRLTAHEFHVADLYD